MSERPRDREIIFVNPPEVSFGRLKRIRRASPPLGILYIATYLRSKGIPASVIDMLVEPERFTREQFADCRVVGLTAATPAFASAQRVAAQIKQWNPGCKVVVGGAHPSVCYADIDDPNIDHVVMGEGEIVMEQFCRAVLEGTGEAFPRILDGTGTVAQMAKLHGSLDFLPPPDRALIDFDRYELSPVNYLQKPSTPVITARGCPFKCSFCSRAVHGNIVNYHTPGYIFEELRDLTERFHVRDIMFWDDTFTFKKDRVRELCELLIASGLKLTWSAAARVDTLDEDLLRLMKQAGCWQLSFGVESGSQRLLKHVNKGITLERVEQAFRLCDKVGVETRAFFILGLPTETREESLKTLEYSKRLRPTFAQFSLAVPYPGSKMYGQALEEGWEPPDWEEFNTYPEDQPAYVTAGREGGELFELQRQAMKGFYLRPSYIWGRLLAIRSFSDFWKNASVALNLLRF